MSDTIAKIRAQYPQYKDVSDADIADAMYRKFYADVPREEFDKKIGIVAPSEPTRADVGAIMAPMGNAPGGETIRANAAGDTRTLPQIREEYLTAQSAGDREKQQQLAEAYATKERTGGGMLYGLSDRVRQVAKGVPLIGKGLDELSAFTSSPFDSKGYEEALDYQRARDRTFEQSRPKESMALQIGGGVASGVAAAPAMAGMIGNAATRGGAVLRGIGAGAGVGAVDNFADAENGFANRAENALIGGAIGGAVGGLAVPVIGGVTNGIQGIANAMARRSVPIGINEGASKVLQRTLANDGMLGDAGATAISRSGPSGMIADVSPGTMGLLDTAMQRGGRAIAPAREAIEGRAASANQSVDQALSSTFGAPRGIATADDAIRSGTQGARSSAYDAAYATPIDYASKAGMQIESMIKNRVPKSIIDQANSIMRLEGVQSPQIMAKLADDGSVVFERMPDVRQVDYIKRALLDVAKRGDGMGAMGGNTTQGRAFGNLAGELRDALAEAVPAYREALDIASDAIGRRDALDLGRTALSPAMARDEFGMALKGMSQAERAEVAQGVRSQIDETLANVRSAISDPNVDARQAVAALNQFSSDAVRDKVKTLVGEGQAEQLFRAMDEARRALSLRAGIGQNSKTFARQAITQQIDEATEPGPLGTFIAAGEQGGLSQGVRALVRTMAGKTPQRLQSEQDALYGDIVKALTGPRGADAASLIQQLSRRGELGQSNEALARAGGLLLGGAATGGAYQAATPMSRREQRLISPPR